MAKEQQQQKYAAFNYLTVIKLSAERMLEDHECVLTSKRDLRKYLRKTKIRYIFRKEPTKYDFFKLQSVSDTPNCYYASKFFFIYFRFIFLRTW